MCFVYQIQIPNNLLKIFMNRILKQMPVEGTCEIPFVGLGKLVSHKKQFSSRIGKHIDIHSTEIGKLLPFVARHFVNQTAFSVHNLIVRQWHHIIFIIHVGAREGDFIVMVFSIDWVFFEIIQSIVHPTHHPFHPETNSAIVDRFG